MKSLCAVILGSMMVCAVGKAGEISSAELVEAFITYVGKAGNVKLDDGMKDKMRQELQMAKDDPLLVPYVFTGKKCDRKVIMESISAGIVKWSSSELDLSSTGKFASDPTKLAALSDAELVMALRLVDQIASKLP